jgi:trans-aconitate methyltransferase
MGVATHLGIDLREYDARIRTFIPAYEEMLDAAAAAVAVCAGSARVLDLGIGTGALAARVLRVLPRARIVGIDSDAAILAVAQRRLGRRLTTIHADFSRAALPRAGAITASLALHHVRTARLKAMLYRRAFAALDRGGVLVSADSCLASNARLQHADRTAWRAHLERSYTPRQTTAFLRAWAKDDVYFPLDEETAMLRRAGFDVDIPWRRGSFAVLVAVRPVRR